MLKKYKRNSIVTIFSDPFKTIPILVVMYFMYPYMYNFSYSNNTIGNIQSIAMGVSSIIATLFAPALINKYGRKLTTIIFGDIVWILFIVALYFVDKTYWALVFAFCMMGLSRIGNTSYTLLFQEDENDTHRQVVNSFLTLLALVATLFYAFFYTPIGKYGIVPTFRWIVIGAGIIYTITTVIRMFTFKETTIGQKLKEDGDHTTFSKSFSTFLNKLPVMLKNPVYAVIILMFAFNMGEIMMMMVQPGYLLGKEIVTEAQYAIVSSGGAVTGCIAMFVILPLVTKFKISDLNVYISASMLGAVALFSLLFLKPGMFVPATIIMGIYGFAQFFSLGYCYVIIVNHSKEADGADILGTATFVAAVATLIYPPLFGYLLDTHKDMAMLACVGIWIANGLSMVAVKVLEKRMAAAGTNTQEEMGKIVNE